VVGRAIDVTEREDAGLERVQLGQSPEKLRWAPIITFYTAGKGVKSSALRVSSVRKAFHANPVGTYRGCL